jgi:hypothetical protein
MEAVVTEEFDEEEQLVRRHRREKKELQGDGKELQVGTREGRMAGLLWGVRGG